MFTLLKNIAKDVERRNYSSKILKGLESLGKFKKYSFFKTCLKIKVNSVLMIKKNVNFIIPISMKSNVTAELECIIKQNNSTKFSYTYYE